MDRGGRQRFLAAGGALFQAGLLVGILGLQPPLIPNLFDRGDDGLQSLKSLNRFLIETKDEELPPMPYFRRIAFNLAENILGCLRGKIHRDLNWALACMDTTRAARALKYREQGIISVSYRPARVEC